VRGDGKLNRSIRDAQSWRNSRFDAQLEKDAGSELKLSIGLSFSGNERNRLFYSRQAEQFVDLSAVSGLDNSADSRVLSLWDFDRDGWQDMVVVNANAPLLNMYRNEIGAVKGSAAATGQMVAIRFVGGSRAAQPNSQFGPRDGYGAKVRITSGELNLIREYRCGEGMAGQNSRTMIVGIGDNDVAQSVTVQWLSGVEQQVQEIPAGTLLTVYEDPASAPEKSAVTREPYVVPSSRQWEQRSSEQFTSVPEVLWGDQARNGQSDDSGKPRVRLYTTMATWCAACKQHLPQLEQLRSNLDTDSLGMYGVPIDVTDDEVMLSEYSEKYRPAYELLTDMKEEQRDQIEQLVSRILKTDALPSTVVTDTNGRVLLVTAGVPTVSELKKILRSQ